jgi:hypothetical protein
MKNSLIEPSREIPVIAEADICVVGGSCTGVFAAVRAARLGARVILVEQQGCFGGVATNGLVNIWHSLHDTVGQQQIIGGLTAEVVERLTRRDAVRITDHLINRNILNTEELKIELDELITEARVQPFLHTFYVAPHLVDGKLEAVIVENKSGRGAIIASFFIDASGDGDLSRSLGVPAYLPEVLQPPTLCAKIYGMNFVAGEGMDSAPGAFNWEQALEEHGHEFGLKEDWGWRCPIPSLPGIFMHADTHVFDVDISRSDDLTRAEIEGRRQVRAIMDVVREYGPPDSQIGLVDLASHIGAREGHRIEGAYRLTGDDVLYGKRFDDAIANGSYRVDIHHSNGRGITFRYLDGTEVGIPGRGNRRQVRRWREETAENPTFYQVPYRCLVPAGVDNLLAAGRILDADPVAFSAVRVMVNMNQTGEAAGVAAWLALDTGETFDSIDTTNLRKILADRGSIIL